MSYQTTNVAPGAWEKAQKWAQDYLGDFEFTELSPNTYLFHGKGFEYRTVICVTPRVSGARYAMCAGDAGELVVQLFSDIDPLFFAARNNGIESFLEKVTGAFRQAEFSEAEWEAFLAHERQQAEGEEDAEDRALRLSKVRDMADECPGSLDECYEVCSDNAYDDPPDLGVVPDSTLRMVALLQTFARLYVQSQDLKEAE